jgi:hypothetical protein
MQFEMKNLLACIDKHNAAHKAHYGDDSHAIVTTNIASEQQIQLLQQRFDFELPVELIHFYKALGGLNKANAVSERGIVVPNIALQVLERKMGIIDTILDYWGNDRYEFLPQEKNFTPEQIAFLNDNYKCIGRYNNRDGLESAGYIYFDTKGNFGELFYHQDYFEEVREDLIKMANGSIATKSLEAVLIDAISDLEDYVTNP